MSNRRQEAREALRIAASRLYDVDPPDELADAVSDVWEPIVRMLADALHDSQYPAQDQAGGRSEALRRAGEALGESGWA